MPTCLPFLAVNRPRLGRSRALTTHEFEDVEPRPTVARTTVNLKQPTANPAPIAMPKQGRETAHIGCESVVAGWLSVGQAGVGD